MVKYCEIKGLVAICVYGIRFALLVCRRRDWMKRDEGRPVVMRDGERGGEIRRNRLTGLKGTVGSGHREGERETEVARKGATERRDFLYSPLIKRGSVHSPGLAFSVCGGG